MKCQPRSEDEKDDMVEHFLNDRVELHCGDCREVLATLAENSLDACVTDPPYGLEFMGKDWDSFGKAPTGGASFSKDGMGKEFKALPSFTGLPNPSCKNCSGSQRGNDRIGFKRCRCENPEFPNSRLKQMIAFQEWSETWAHEVYRVLKPGAHLIAMGGTRTYHRMACAIEDAGFEIRDTVSWLYGSGFPKSHDVSKGIDRAAGAEREIVGPNRFADLNGKANLNVYGFASRPDETVPATDAAREWQGWGTALKPACELIVLARKPLSEPTVAANVLRWGCGAINVDGCRVGFANDADEAESKIKNQHEDFGSAPRQNKIYGKDDRAQVNYNPTGRWPANLLHDGSDEVVAAFPDVQDGRGTYQRGARAEGEWLHAKEAGTAQIGFNDSGSAARFFYTAKADAMDRIGSRHPTIKPLDLMQWLVRLVTPPRGTVLDPFAGTGTTGEAAWREGMGAVLIEAEPEYQADIRRRMALVLAGPDERQRESIKARNLPRDDGPLFGGIDREYPPTDRVAYGEFAEGGGGSHKRKPRDDGPLFAGRETWDEMWQRPFDFSREPKP